MRQLDHESGQMIFLGVLLLHRCCCCCCCCCVVVVVFVDLLINIACCLFVISSPASQHFPLLNPIPSAPSPCTKMQPRKHPARYTYTQRSSTNTPTSSSTSASSSSSATQSSLITSSSSSAWLVPLRVASTPASCLHAHVRFC